jgi:hypothetical protein
MSRGKEILIGILEMVSRNSGILRMVLRSILFLVGVQRFKGSKVQRFHSHPWTAFGMVEIDDFHKPF